MSQLDEREQRVYNAGERLIPGITHGVDEWIRHRSAYVFWRTVIETDLRNGHSHTPVRVLDLGCGVGHGCKTLTDNPQITVVGIDNDADTIEYARSHYAHENISYLQADIRNYVAEMSEFDYVISRNVFEHIENGLALLAQIKYRARLMIDVPYDEDAENPQHQLTVIHTND